MGLLEDLAQVLAAHEAEHEIALYECGREVDRFDTVAAAKQYLQNTFGEGYPLAWHRRQEGEVRELVSGQFAIRSVRKEVPRADSAS